MEIYVAGVKEKHGKQRLAVSTKALLNTGQFFSNIPSLTEKFYKFWDLMDVIERHGYLRSAISAVGRGTVGAWWNIYEHPQFRGKGEDSARNKLFDFYSSRKRTWDNIKDFQNMAYKLMIAAMYLKYFGQAAFYIVRTKGGKAIGIDFLHGMIIPNVDDNGYFKSPAFYQLSSETATPVGFESDEIVFISNPDLRGDVVGGSDVESLSEYSLPTDIYLLTAAREYIKNRDKPEAIYELPADITDEAFDEFAEMLAKKYRGPTGAGRSPVVVQGELNIKELSKMPEDLPFAESRSATRDEIIAASGSNAVKLGLSDATEGDTREMRREFLEGTLLPLFRMIEVAFYEQIHLREFGIREWEFKFEHPDFLTSVEEATVHMRYFNMGVLNPNEIRNKLGLAPREDEDGDEYYKPIDANTKLAEAEEQAENDQGSPPEGREDRPDKPSNTGEPTDDNQDPPRGDQHDDPNRPRGLGTNLDKELVLDELFLWKEFATKRVKKDQKLRPFVSNNIPSEISDLINNYLLSSPRTVEEIKSYFDGAINLIKEQNDGKLSNSLDVR